MIADELDIKTLCQWRATCRLNYTQGTSSLRRSLLKVLNPFVRNPSSFVDLLTKQEALIGGEVALAFILRDCSYSARDLEVFATPLRFGKLCDAIIQSLNSDRVRTSSRIQHNTNFALRRLVSITFQIDLFNGRSIHVHCSFTCTAVAGIARTITTALSNYVSGQGFACSHPHLTLQRRALLADIALDAHNQLDYRVMGNMVAQGFQFAVSPSVWPEYHYLLGDNMSGETFQCCRSLYVCPSQGRFFGDAGSFINYFDPLAGDAASCISRSLPPYGPMLVWRLWSAFRCSANCDELNEFLGDGLTSIPVVFVDDSRDNARDVQVDRLDGRKRPQSFRHPRCRSKTL